MNEIAIIEDQFIQNKIYTLRGLQVMLDRDLAELYGVETKVFNQAVKRNSARFPEDFMFQLTKEEFVNWRSQFVTSNEDKMGLRRAPYAFTEQGVSMLSAILKSSVAVDMSLKIIRSFVAMRKFISSNALLFQKIDTMEKKLLKHDEKFDQLFNAIESKEVKPKEGIFYENQIFDAYVFASDLIKSAKTSIVLIDNYIDESVLLLLSKRADGCKATIYTKTITSQLSLDLKKYNTQYQPIEINELATAHDRFLILDDSEIYHIGASLKDLGKKWFAFSKFEKGAIEMLARLK